MNQVKLPVYFSFFVVTHFTLMFSLNLIGQESRTSKVEGGISKAISYIPDVGPTKNLEKGLKSYLKIIGLTGYQNSIEDRNVGISGYFSDKYANSKCYHKVVDNFYQDIAKYDDKFYRDIKNEPLGGRPSLNSSSSKGKSKFLKEGWLWDLALKHSGGNKNLAMEIIGICGHDDAMQGSISRESNSEKAKVIRRKEIERKEKLIKNLKEKLNNDPTMSNARYSAARNRIEREEGALGKLKNSDKYYEKLTCPNRFSRMYLPHSLGSGVGISDEFKKKLVKIQAPTKGAKVLPAKQYHVYGSAFMACKLVQDGVSKSLVPKIQTTAARGYRGIRICEKVTKDLDKRDQLVELYEANKGDYMKVYKPRLTRRGVRKKPTTYPSLETFYSTKLNEYLDGKACVSDKTRVCYLFDDIGISNNLSKAEAKKKLKNYIDTLNTSYLYSEWYVGPGEMVGFRAGCSDVRLFGPRSLKVKKRKKGRGIGVNKCIPGFSNKACESAKAKLETWDVDFEWTANQHRAGSEFSSDKCYELEAGDTIDDIACSSLKGFNSGNSPKNK